MVPSTLTPAGPTPIDRASLVERCMGDAGFAGMIVAKFQAQLADLADRVDRAAAARDASATAKAAHALKGASANLSAGDVQAVAQLIETAAGRGDLVAVAPSLPVLREHVQRCLAYLPTLAAELGRAAA